MSWKLEIVREWDSVWEECHVERWRSHMDASPSSHVFFHPALVRAWVKTYMPLRTLSPLFVWAEHDSGAVVFLPLVLWRQNWKNAWLRSIVPVGYSDFDYHDPISAGRADYASFWHALKERLRREVCWDEILLDGLHSAFMPKDWERSGEEPCPYIELGGFASVDDYLATRNKKMRYNLRRQEKKAREAAELSFKDFSAANVEEALAELPTMLECHRRRWPHAYKAPRFHEHLLREGLQGGVLHFSRLSFGEEAASWRIGFYDKRRYYSYMPAINPNFFDYGPGKMHLLHCIQFAIERQLPVYDQLRGAELYKSEWTQHDETIYCMACKNKTISAAAKACLVHARKIIRK